MESPATSMGRIFSLGIPVTLTRFLSTMVMSLEAIMIPRRLLSSGMNTEQATAVFGQFVGISQTLVFTPGVLTIAMATALVPAISDALASGNIRLVNNRVEEAVRLTMISGIPMTAVFLVLPWELCQVLFGYGSAGAALMILSFSGPFVYLSQTVTGILQGLGRPSIPFKNMLLSSTVKLAGIYFLTSLANLNIKGAAISIGVSYMIMSWLNYRDLKNITGLKPDVYLCFIKPVIATCCCGVVMWQAKGFLLGVGLPAWLSLAVSLSAGAVSYLLVLYMIGGISKGDFLKMTGAINKTHH